MHLLHEVADEEQHVVDLPLTGGRGPRDQRMGQIGQPLALVVPDVLEGPVQPVDQSHGESVCSDQTVLVFVQLLVELRVRLSKSCGEPRFECRELSGKLRVSRREFCSRFARRLEVLKKQSRILRRDALGQARAPNRLKEALCALKLDPLAQGSRLVVNRQFPEPGAKRLKSGRMLHRCQHDQQHLAQTRQRIRVLVFEIVANDHARARRSEVDCPERDTGEPRKFNLQSFVIEIWRL